MPSDEFIWAQKEIELIAACIASISMIKTRQSRLLKGHTV